MKKIISAIMSATIALSSFAALAVTANAEDTWAPTATSYTADFTNANELEKWYKGGGTTTSAVVSDGTATITTGNWSQYFLPVAKTENFVMEADVTHTAGYNGVFHAFFGADAATKTVLSNNAMWFRLGDTAKGARCSYTNGSGVARDTNADGAFKWNIIPYSNSTLNQNFKLRLVVYNKRVAAWMDDQLLYAYPLETSYAGGYIGLTLRYNTVVLRSLSVRPATASDLVFAESFNESGTFDFTSTLAGGDSGKITAKNWGAAELAAAGGTATHVDKNKTVVADHVYSAGFTFGNTNNWNGAYIAPMFGIKDSGESYGVMVRLNGEILIKNITDDTTLGYSSPSNTKAKLADKLEAYSATDSTMVLKRNVNYEYRHVLHDGTLDVYLDDILMTSVKSDEFNNLSGYTGFCTNGTNSFLHYFGVRGVEATDLNRVNEVKLTDQNGEALANKVVRVYAEDNTLYGTTYANANGMFDMDMGHNQKYTIKAYNTDGTLVAETDEAVTYVSNGSTNTFALTKYTPSAATDIAVVGAYADGQELDDGSVVEGDASLLEFTVNANDYAVSKITIAPSEGEAKTCATTLAAGADAVIGIIVNAFVADNAAANELFTVTVE